ncbi:MAG TPA: hypothetical protein VHT26_12010 [Trebonia sp.]|nr:hypothetical protein [Trebonia sp.]
MSETEEKAPSAAAAMFGDFAPALVGFTDDTLFGQVWTRPELSPRDRSLITVACNTHLAFYAGWPRAMSAMAVAKEVFGRSGGTEGKES